MSVSTPETIIALKTNTKIVDPVNRFANPGENAEKPLPANFFLNGTVYLTKSVLINFERTYANQISGI